MKALWRFWALSGLAAALGLGFAGAAELNVGDEAPAFALMGSDGKTHKLAELHGKTVVVAWFPKADTPG